MLNSQASMAIHLGDYFKLIFVYLNSVRLQVLPLIIFHRVKINYKPTKLLDKFGQILIY